MNTATGGRSAKVPEIVFMFWVIKIAATTLGETGGDTLSMSMKLGYLTSSFIFLGIFIAFVIAQIHADRFKPWLYWSTIIATTLVGTTMADFADRSLGIGYLGGSALLFALVMLDLAIWRFALGSISINQLTSRKAEAFYWATILASNTLGTALGDLVSDGFNAGFSGGVLIFSAALLIIAAIYYFTSVSHVVLFWAAFILTRPLGATLGDLLTKPISHGGFNLSRPESSIIIAAFVAACVLAIPQRAGNHPAAS